MNHGALLPRSPHGALPLRDKFYSELNEGRPNSEEVYDRALEMWRRYDCKTFEDYRTTTYNRHSVLLFCPMFSKIGNYTRPSAHTSSTPLTGQFEDLRVTVSRKYPKLNWVRNSERKGGEREGKTDGRDSG